MEDIMALISLIYRQSPINRIVWFVYIMTNETSIEADVWRVH